MITVGQYLQGQRDPEQKPVDMQALLAPLAAAMKTWKTDKIANKMLNEMEPPRAEAVGKGAAGANRAASQAFADHPDWTAANTTGPATGGLEELKLHLATEAAAERQKSRGLNDTLIGERIAAMRAKKNAPNAGLRIFHEQQGGVTFVNPQTGEVSYKRADGMPERSPTKPSYDPVQMKAYGSDLTEYKQRKQLLETESTKLKGTLAKWGLPPEALETLTNFRRLNDQQAGDPTGDFFAADGPDGKKVAGKWNEWLKAAPDRAKLQEYLGQLAALKEPTAPAAMNRSGGAQSAAAPSINTRKRDQALAWAQENPNDPRAAAILKALGN